MPMLIELLGWPGSGKSTLVRELGIVAPQLKFVPNWLRRSRTVVASVSKAMPQLDRHFALICTEYAIQPVSRWRRSALLRADHGIAVAAQRSTQLLVADELLLHSIFGTAGPRKVVPAGLRAIVADIVRSTYQTKDVMFIAMHPVMSEWERRLRARKRGGSRYGVGGDEELFSQLRADCLLEEALEILRLEQMRVLRVVPEEGRVRQAAEACWRAVQDELSNREADTPVGGLPHQRDQQRTSKKTQEADAFDD
jgi:hypothetical protein